MLILASASPRRTELLWAAGIAHRVEAANIPEVRMASEEPEAFVRRMAQEKASAIPTENGDVVLGADTIVCLHGEVLGKPASDDDAAQMLRFLSGVTHRVLTGVCLKSQTSTIVDIASTDVTFQPLSDEEIRTYIRSGEHRDKAGAYAIQGLASKFVHSISGSYSNVVGLPVSLVYRHLKAL